MRDLQEGKPLRGRLGSEDCAWHECSSVMSIFSMVKEERSTHMIKTPHITSFRSLNVFRIPVMQGLKKSPTEKMIEFSAGPSKILYHSHPAAAVATANSAVHPSFL